MENLLTRISIDKNICNGKPAIRGKRITVNTILEFLSAGEQADEILRQYPGLEVEDVYACLQYAAEIVNKSFLIKPEKF